MMPYSLAMWIPKIVALEVNSEASEALQVYTSDEVSLPVAQRVQAPLKASIAACPQGLILEVRTIEFQRGS